MFDELKEKQEIKIAKRFESNLEIIERLRDYFLSHSDIRFIQGLWNLGIINRGKVGVEDRFYEESIDTLNTLAKDEVIKHEIQKFDRR